LMIDDHWHSMIGIHAQEFRVELIPTLDVHRDDLVGKATFLEQDGDLLAIGRRPIMDVDHDAFPRSCKYRRALFDRAALASAPNPKFAQGTRHTRPRTSGSKGALAP